MRILLSEGASTSAREAITALGLAGHHLEVCDPDPHCIGRFSRFVRRFHRCPGLSADPEGYLAFVLDRIAGGRFDVLFPIHEQGFLFARVRERLLAHVKVALPAFESYRRAHSKAGFRQILSDLGLPQPQARLVTSAAGLVADRFPVVVKLSVGTASRGIWIVGNAGELQHCVGEIEQANGFGGDGVLVQEFVEGPTEHAQAVFADGRLVASHAFRRIAAGAGGGAAIKKSVPHTDVRAHLARIGEHLRWHGALSVDVIRAGGVPYYIDCNPRLVEPMSAQLAGLDLADLLLRVSCGGAPAAVPEGRVGVRTHIAIQALLGCALHERSRLALLRECWRLLARRGPYAGSQEELTPARLDWRSVIPTVVTALWLLATPGAARYLPQRGWGAHLLTPASIRAIENLGAERTERR